MNTLDTTGRVYFPTPESKPIQGARLYTKENGLFIEFCYSEYPPIEKCEIILGEFNSLGQITCLFNRYSGGTIGYPDSICRYKISYLFIGHEFETRKEIIFHTSSFRINSLFDWFNIRTIKYSSTPNPRVDFGSFQKIVFDIKRFKDTSFSFGYSLNVSGQKTTVSEIITFNLKAEESLDFLDFYKVMLDLRKFYMLFTNAKFDIEQIIFENQNIKDDFGNKPINPIKSIKLLNKINEIYPSPSSDYLNLTFSEIKDYLPEILSNWYNLGQDNIAVDYLLEKSYNKDLSAKTYFLNMCFAIEIYHKNHFRKGKLKRTEFKKIKDYLLKVVKNKTAFAWLLNKFALGNTPSFKDRLIFYKIDLDNLTNSDSTQLINRIVLTRNSIVHSSSSSKKIINDEIELYFTALTIEAILKCLILNNLGLPLGKISGLKESFKKAIMVLKDINR